MSNASPSQAPSATDNAKASDTKEAAGQKDTKETGENQKKSNEKPKDLTNSARDKLAGIVPDAFEGGSSATSMLEYKSLPRMSLRTIGKATGAVAIATNPVLAASMYVPYKTWSGIKGSPPFSWVHRVGSRVYSGVKKVGEAVTDTMVRPVFDVVSYPARFIGTASYNLAIAGLRGLSHGKNFLHDIFVHEEGESLNIMEKVVKFVGSLPNRCVKLVEAVLPKVFAVFPELAKRPIRSMLLVALLAGGTATAAAFGTEVLALLGASTSLISSLAKFVLAAAAWL